jgi:hypothetical protein
LWEFGELDEKLSALADLNKAGNQPTLNSKLDLPATGNYRHAYLLVADYRLNLCLN